LLSHFHSLLPVISFVPASFITVVPRSALENRVIPAKAGIHCVSDQQWTPALAGVTSQAILIPLGGPQAHDHSE
jgi:hypothetical protein